MQSTAMWPNGKQQRILRLILYKNLTSGAGKALDVSLLTPGMPIFTNRRHSTNQEIPGSTPGMG